MSQKYLKKTCTDKIPDVCMIAVLTVFLLFFTIPFIHLVMVSVSDANRIGPGLRLWPAGFTLDSYKVTFTTRNILNGMCISVLRALIGSFSILLVNSLAAFVISKDGMIGVKYLRLFFIITMYASGGLIPKYLVIKSLSLSGTFWVYIFPMLCTPFYLLLLKTYMQSIPGSLEESALIDGASYPAIYCKITIPLCKPILAAVGLFALINHWNAMTDAAIYNSMNTELHTLQYILYNIIKQASASLEISKDMIETRNIDTITLRMAITVVTIMPVFTIYPFIQRYFISGLMVGAIKA